MFERVTLLEGQRRKNTDQKTDYTHGNFTALNKDYTLFNAAKLQTTIGSKNEMVINRKDRWLACKNVLRSLDDQNFFFL